MYILGILDVNIKMEATAQFRDESVVKLDVKPEPEDEENISVNSIMIKMMIKSVLFYFIR